MIDEHDEQAQAFNDLAERLLSTLIQAGAVTAASGDVRATTDLAVSLAESLQASLTRRKIRRRDAKYITPAEWDAIDTGRKIEAIRLMRSRTGLGLKESKDAVEAAMKMSAVDRLALLRRSDEQDLR